MKLSQKNHFSYSNDQIYRILVVVGGMPQKNQLKITLESQGYDVSEARNSFDALSLLAESDFDAVVLEQELIGVKWDKLCEYIYKALEMPHLPILLVSENNVEMTVIDNLNSSSFDFIRKPYDSVELLARVERFAQTKNGPSFGARASAN